jgi:SAM-dependent methyltransferase
MNSSDIYIDGTYLKNNPDWGIKDAAWKAEIISQLLKKNNFAPKEIIEVGCGAGGILKALSNDFGKNVKLTGYDISPQAIAMAKKLENENLNFYNEDISQAQNIHTNLLLTIDVLEHVDDYYNFLLDIRSKSEFFVFHIPLDLACRTILKPHILMQQRNAVGHIHYFTKEMVQWILKDKGYTIVDWIYTKPVIDVYPPDSFKRRIKKILRNLSFSINRDLSAKLWGGYSMMILAK